MLERILKRLLGKKATNIVIEVGLPLFLKYFVPLSLVLGIWLLWPDFPLVQVFKVLAKSVE